MWGMGDGSTLTTFDTPFGRVGGLLCWELYMPLARVAMYEQHVDILLAPTWDNSDVWPRRCNTSRRKDAATSSASHRACAASDVPTDIPGHDELYGDPDDWMSRGNTLIVDPYGEVLDGPVSETEAILYADVDIATVRQSRRRVRRRSATTRAPTSSGSKSAERPA